MSTKNLVMCALLAAVICVLAPVSVPIGPVPISLGTFAIMLAGVLLGAKYGTISTLLYLLIGGIGVPVYAGYSAGFDKLAGPTGGYLVGFIPLAFICGLIYSKMGRSKKGVSKIVFMMIAMIAATAVLYALGTVWFCIVTKMDPVAALGACVIPFLPGDFIKMVVIALIEPQIEKALNKAGVLAFNC